MRSAERDQGAASTDAASTEQGPALRDAESAAARVEADEADAVAARERLRAGPLDALEPDPQVGQHLGSGELVYGVRLSAILRPASDDRALGYGGTLYLTSRRLIHIGQMTVNVQLSDIRETAIAGERLLITLLNGEGLSFDLDRPRVLRTYIAAAMRGARP